MSSGVLPAGRWRSLYYVSPDGLLLHARDYGPREGGGVPVLCLSGLTRNSRDFHDVACRLSAQRRVICPDYRGRGQSEWAKDWQTYRPDVELADVVALLDVLAIPRVAVIGTSRGGIVAMVMAATQRHRMAGALLNDVGPRLEPAGLLRIANLVGRNPGGLDDWNGAVAALKRINLGFDLSEDEWMAFARRVFGERDGRPVLDYDPDLARTFPSAQDIEGGKVAELWPLFASLAGLPLAVVRGDASDLLSRETVAAMAAAHPGLDAVEARGRAHAPFLDEPESAAAIDRLLERAV